ncbi:type II toxin-antitoxin system VapC family toxin [Methylobacillus caricis]|uniref:type II toxin-antitoxin system VapC family toxin n=1 Tax=Methylobacillus caricis TaxID=1971611 RepID=UPI001CFF9EF5|nr:type II toxin-antitoxin system VapC family toxin [Methylobacillus caricis]MCB5187254.1 type II toxin-antitoxin system VapC family toxin [Methylobacillus caricis]
MILLDTNTISYYFRGDAQVVPRLQALSPADVGVPAIAAYELRYGLLRLPTEVAAPRLVALAQLLGHLQIMPFDAECAEHAAGLRADLEQLGTPIGPHDTLIAATALRHDAALVTRNVREFSRVPGLQIINWHDDDAPA